MGKIWNGTFACRMARPYRKSSVDVEAGFNNMSLDSIVTKIDVVTPRNFYFTENLTVIVTTAGRLNHKTDLGS